MSRSSALLVASVFLGLLALCRPCSAQPSSTGTQFLVAMPAVRTATSEKPLPNPLQLVVSSVEAATVRIRTARAESSPPFDTTVVVRAGSSCRVRLPLHTGPDVSSGTVGNTTYQVTSDVPVQVVTEQHWNGNGERAIHLPIEAWGKEYRTFHWSTDQYKTAGSMVRRPNQIVVIASMDNTVVTIRPRRDIAGGPDLERIPAGTSGSVLLHTGQTLYVEDIADSTTVTTPASDLTGTLVTADKPIAVIAGCTKASVARMPPVLPPSGPFAFSAHFVRNNIHEVMLPTSMADTTFVVGSVLYVSGRHGFVPKESAGDIGMDSSAGSVVRVLALEDGTIVTQQEPGWPQPLPVAVLAAGETYTDSVVVHGAIVHATKPVLCFQYGKSWALILLPAADDVQGHPTVESGMPFMQVVPSVNQWLTRSVFDAPEGMDNTLSIVVRTDDLAGLLLDGRSLSQRYAVKTVGDYSIAKLAVGAGSHILTHAADRRWMAWLASTLDGLQQGRAQGSPVGIGVPAGPAPTDSLVVLRDTLYDDGRWEADLRIVDRATGADNFRSAAIRAVENMMTTVNRDVNGVVRVRGHVLKGRIEATTVVRLEANSGTAFSHSFRWAPLTVEWSPWHWFFGSNHVRNMACLKRTVHNRSNRTVTITTIGTTVDRVVVVSQPTRPVVIGPGDSTDIEVCLRSVTEEALTITAGLEFRNPVYLVDSVPFSVTFTAPRLVCSDYNFNVVPRSDMTIVKPVWIRAEGSDTVHITGIDRTELDASNIFTLDSGLSEFPIAVPPGHRIEVKVGLHCKNVEGPTTVRIPLLSDAVGLDTVIELMVVGSTTSVAGDAVAAAVNVAPNPVGRDGSLRIPCRHRARLSVTDLEGRTLWSGEADVDDPVIPVTSLGIHSAGRYVLTIEEVGRVAVHLPVVVL